MSSPESLALWLASAEEDLLNIENNLLAAKVPWRTVCFHAQQTGEKYLKALPVRHNRAPPRTHDLPRLLSLCGDYGLDVRLLQQDCALLTRFAVETRYPEIIAQIGETEGSEAVPAAKRIRAAVLPLVVQATGP